MLDNFILIVFVYNQKILMVMLINLLILDITLDYEDDC